MTTPLFLAISAWGKIAWGRGGAGEGRPPFLVWRFADADEETYRTIACVVGEFCGAVAWGVHRSGRNWVIEPVEVASFAGSANFRTDLEMSDSFAAQFPDLVKGALSDLPQLANWIRKATPLPSSQSSKMSTELDIEYLWIPHALGGHRAAPYVGMRPTIRWQRYLQEHLERSRDVECTRITFDPASQRGSATVRLISDDPMPPEWLHEGNLIELLDGYKVIAVGRITSTHRRPGE
jgi:hypothetical protein